MMFGSLSKMKSKMMVVKAFVFFFPVTLELNGKSETIAVLVDRHVEQILMSVFFTVLFFP